MNNEKLHAVHQFLLGEAPLRGCQFGEVPANRGTYWWRNDLSEAIAEAAPTARDAGTIAMPAFHDLVRRVYEAEMAFKDDISDARFEAASQARNALIEHIDKHVAAAVKAEADKYANLKDDHLQHVAKAKQEAADLRALSSGLQAACDSMRADLAKLRSTAGVGEPVAMVDDSDDGMFASILPNVSVKVGQMLYAATALAADTLLAPGAVQQMADAGLDVTYGDVKVPARAATAPVSAVPTADDEEAHKLARILWGMVEGGGANEGVNIYSADYSAPDGDVFVHRAGELLVEQAAEIKELTRYVDTFGSMVAQSAGAPVSAAEQAPSLLDELRAAKVPAGGIPAWKNHETGEAIPGPAGGQELPAPEAIVAAVHAASATGRIALTITGADGVERPTNVAECFVRELALGRSSDDKVDAERWRELMVRHQTENGCLAVVSWPGYKNGWDYVEDPVGEVDQLIAAKQAGKEA